MPKLSPSESSIQQAYFQWVRIKERSDYRYEAIYAIPNAGLRTKQNGSRMKAEGMKAGIPDIFISVPISNYAGLYIELKKEGGKLSQTQKSMLGLFNRLGYKTLVCYSLKELIEATEKYMRGC